MDVRGEIYLRASQSIDLGSDHGLVATKVCSDNPVYVSCDGSIISFYFPAENDVFLFFQVINVSYDIFLYKITYIKNMKNMSFF